MMVELIKDSAWIQMHNLLFGYSSVEISIDDTKTAVKDAWERQQKGLFDPKSATKGLCDCIVFYNKYKSILDD